MVRHIVMWKFKEGSQAAAKEFLEKLNGLNGVIKEIKFMQTGISLNKDGEYDACLIADFETVADLEAYRNDPRHKAVSSLCKSIRVLRSTIDYEI